MKLYYRKRDAKINVLYNVYYSNLMSLFILLYLFLIFFDIKLLPSQESTNVLIY